MRTDDSSGKQALQPEKYIFHSPPNLFRKSRFICFSQPRMKKIFFYFSFSIFASLKICLRLSSMLCSGNVCMMFNCRLYFICTSVAWNSTVRGSHSPLLIPMPAVLWVTTFLKKGMNELIKLSLQSILTSIHCLLILIAFSLLTLSGNLLPVLIFAFSSYCSYCFSKCRYHSFLSF